MSQPADTPAARSAYRPELDILRFCCFFLVFLHHGLPRAGDGLASSLVDAAAFAMPVFFLLSSFLITQLLLRERAATGTVHIPAFYLRRILRIWPLYFAFFALCAVLGAGHTRAFQPITARMAEFFLLLAGNWYLVLFGVPVNPVNVLWSISIEEQFYVLWPWLARAGGARAVQLLAAILIPGSYVALYGLAQRGTDADVGLWVNTLVQMQFFALGGLLALWLARRPRLLLPVAARAGLAVVVLGSWLAAAGWCRLKRPDPHISPAHACVGYALVAIGTVAMFLFFYGLPVGSGKLARAFVYLGKISFGLYAFHMLALSLAVSILQRVAPGRSILLACDALGLALTIVLAAISYRVLESPALRLKERFTFIPSRPV